MSTPFVKALREFAVGLSAVPEARPVERIVARRLARDLDDLAGWLEGREAGVDLVSIICHDLRDPLASMAMGAGFLGRMGGLDAAPLRVVEAMARSAERMNQMVTGLHDLARLEAGRVALHLHEGDLVAIARRAALPFVAMADERGVALVHELPDAPMAVTCDSARIDQVLASLLGSAVRAAPRGGRVVLSARVEPDAVHVEVSDTGAPIPADRLKDAFDSVPGARRVRDGVGFELAIARAVVELHGGTIGASSGPVATTFAFTLPRP